MIFIDESGTHLGMVNDYARAEGGNRAEGEKPFNRGKKFSILGAISTDEIIAMMEVEGAANKEVFLTFVEELLIKKLEPRHYVIFDNVSFHTQEEVLNLIQGTGATVVFLPPYSPDFSPIENMWSKIKTFLKKSKARTVEQYRHALFMAIHTITSRDLLEWYEACGYES